MIPYEEGRGLHIVGYAGHGFSEHGAVTAPRLSLS